MDLLVKLGFKLNLEKRVLEPTQSITFLGLQIGMTTSFNAISFPFKTASFLGEQQSSFEKLYTRRKNKFHSKCLTLSNGDWDKSFLIPQDVKSEISHWLTVLNQWNGKEISLFPSYDYVLTTDASESGTCTTLKKGKKIIKT
ncbi:hypothetical protein ACTFIW_000922 [Dictyostelium discoideum]